MNPNKTIEERVGILEQSHQDCKDKQTERWEGLKALIASGDKENMKQIESMKTKIGTWTIAIIVVVLTTLANIGVMVLSMLLKR